MTPVDFRSYLYVPADRPDRLARAFERGAGALIVDLEDSVAPAAKDQAREQLVRWLEGLTSPPVPVWVRINADIHQEADVEALAPVGTLAGLCIAKAESAEVCERIARSLDRAESEARLAPLIESARGLEQLAAIARVDRVSVLRLGEIDLAADLDLDPSEDESELQYARSKIVVASRAAGLEPPVAPVSGNFADPAAFAATSRRLRRMGFFGRDCIHPAQVAIANDVWSFDEAEKAWAVSVTEALARSGGAAVADASGRMLDEAVVRRARRILGGS